MQKEASEQIAKNSASRYLACAALLGLAAAARFYHLGTESLWLDESYSLVFSNRTLLNALTAERTTPPLYYLLLFFWIKLFGQSESALRSMSALASLSAVPLTFHLGRKLYDERTGLLAAVLMSFSSFQIYYAQEARAYVLLLPIVLASSVILLELLKEKQSSRLLLWCCYITLSVLAVYTHVYGTFSIAAQNLIVLIALLRQSFKNKKLLLPWTASQLIILASYTPWILRMHSAVSGFENERRFILLKLPQVIFSLIYGNQLIPIDEQATLNIKETLLNNAPILLLAAAVVIVLGARAICLLQKQSFQGIFLLAHFLVPVSLSFCLTFFVPIFDEGYLIGTSPFLFLFLVSALSRDKSEAELKDAYKPRRRLLLNGAYLILFALISAGLYRYYFDPRFGKEQWREAAAFIESTAGGDDLLVFDRYYHDVPYRNYQSIPLKDIKFKKLEQISANELNSFESEHKAALLEHTRVWLIRIRSRNENTELYLKRYYKEVDRKFFPKDKGILVIQLERRELK